MITREDIMNSPDNHVFVFGDNLDHTGYGGQAAVAREFVKTGKAFGIPTKRHPTANSDAYFSDQPDEIAIVMAAFIELVGMAKNGKYIVFFPGIGEGYARLSSKSPRIYKMVKNCIYGLLGRCLGEVRKG